MRLFWSLIACVLCLPFQGCGSIPNAGVEPGGIGRYSNIVVVPLLFDLIRVEPSDKGKSLLPHIYITGWETRDKAVKIVEELFAGSGTSVRGITSFNGLLPTTPVLSESEWISEVVQKLHESNLVGNDEIVFLLRPNAIDEYGGRYSSFQNLILSVYSPYSPSFWQNVITGVIETGLGIKEREEIYLPFFYLLVNAGGFEKNIVGPSLCSIGFDAAIFNATSMTCIADTKNILGQEEVPDDSFRDVGWEEFSGEERMVAKMYCISALRRAIAVAMNRLQLMMPRE